MYGRLEQLLCSLNKEHVKSNKASENQIKMLKYNIAMNKAKAKNNLDVWTKVSNRLEKKLVQSKKEKKNVQDKSTKVELLNAEVKAKIMSFQEAIDTNNSASAEVSKLAKKGRK